MDGDFFEPVAPPPEPERWEPPEWFQPPTDEFAALVPDRRILARTDRGVVILLSHIDVFSTGCLLRVRVSVHNRDDTPPEDWIELHDVVLGGRHHHLARRSNDLPDELLRFGVRFVDGSKATTTGAPVPPVPDERPDGPVLRQHGGGGGGGDRMIASTWSLWLWPLPPAEPFDLVFEWPAFDVELSQVSIDGRQIRDAAADVASFWGQRL